MNEFAVFILTNGRPDNVITYRTLERQGYTGKVFLIVDDEDKKKDTYIKNFGDKVIVFSKSEISKSVEVGHHDDKEKKVVVYARNACFKIAKDIGIKYFLQLDDDYTGFDYRFNSGFEYLHKKLKISLDYAFSLYLEFLKNTPLISSICCAQGGDFIGGAQSGVCLGKGKLTLKRKVMNSFFCKTDKPFSFLGMINEDLNTYTRQASTGLVFFTFPFLSLEQKATQSNAGGMTGTYLSQGTYVKSFYSVMYSPSCVSISKMGAKDMRFHHLVKWNNAVPKILKESVKRSNKC